MHALSKAGRCLNLSLTHPDTLLATSCRCFLSLFNLEHPPSSYQAECPLLANQHHLEFSSDHRTTSSHNTITQLPLLNTTTWVYTELKHTLRTSKMSSSSRVVDVLSPRSFNRRSPALTTFPNMSENTGPSTTNPPKSPKSKQRKWKQSLKGTFARLLPTSTSEVAKLKDVKAKLRLNQKNLCKRQAEEKKLAELEARSTYLDPTKTADQWIQRTLVEQQQTTTTEQRSSEVIDTIRDTNELIQKALAACPDSKAGKLEAMELLQGALKEYQTIASMDDLETLQCLLEVLAELQTAKPNEDSGSDPSAIPDEPGLDGSEFKTEDLEEWEFLSVPCGPPPPEYSSLSRPPTYRTSCSTPADASGLEFRSTSMAHVSPHQPPNHPLSTPYPTTDPLQAKQQHQLTHHIHSPTQYGLLTGSHHITGDFHIDTLPTGTTKISAFTGNLHINTILPGTTLTITTFTGDIHITTLSRHAKIRIKTLKGNMLIGALDGALTVDMFNGEYVCVDQIGVKGSLVVKKKEWEYGNSGGDIAVGYDAGADQGPRKSRTERLAEVWQASKYDAKWIARDIRNLDRRAMVRYLEKRVNMGSDAEVYGRFGGLNLSMYL